MNSKRKLIITIVLGVMFALIGAVGFYYWYENEYYVSTEDAKVIGDLVKVSPQISSKLLEFNLDEGQTVEKGQIIGRQEMTNLPDSSLELATVRAPISGLVLKENGNVGEAVAPGQVLAVLVDPQNLYITANVEETKLNRLKPGEKVDVTIDEYPGVAFVGKVKSIGLATAATFSMLPSSTGGNFTKVVQKVPVKISLDYAGYNLLPGTNAVVKIHIR